MTQVNQRTNLFNYKQTSNANNNIHELNNKLSVGSHANATNLFLNYFTNLSIQPKLQVDKTPDTAPNLLRTITDSKKNTNSGREMIRNVSFNHRPNNNNNNNNVSMHIDSNKQETYKNSNSVKNLVKKHESLNEQKPTFKTELAPKKSTTQFSTEFIKPALLTQMTDMISANHCSDGWKLKNIEPGFSNSLNLSPSSSSNSSSNSCSNSGNFSDSNSNVSPSFRDTRRIGSVILAFDNLTYSSSIDDLNTDCTEAQCLNNRSLWRSESISDNVSNNNNEVPKLQQHNNSAQSNQMQNCNLKKNLKSIKRKDRMKKKSDEPAIMPQNSLADSSSLAQSMPDLSSIAPTQKNSNQVETISNSEYEKRLRKKFRSKALSRSLRRAKSIYYCNIRSKSMEDLTAEEKSLFKAGSNISLCFAENNAKLKRSMSRMKICSSMDSCVSGLASDISSSYFHELSDWSPVFSSCESDSSKDDDLFESIDWDKNFANLALSDEEEDEENFMIFGNKNYQSEPFEERIKDLSPGPNLNTGNMDNVSRILHSESSFCSSSKEFINNLITIQITEAFIKDSNGQSDQCQICSTGLCVNDNVSVLECNHLFHTICLKTWLTKSSKCPSCRTNKTDQNNNRFFTKKLETLI